MLEYNDDSGTCDTYHPARSRVCEMPVQVSTDSAQFRLKNICCGEFHEGGGSAGALNMELRGDFGAKLKKGRLTEPSSSPFPRIRPPGGVGAGAQERGFEDGLERIEDLGSFERDANRDDAGREG
jgi:hypothetical protein